MLQSTQERLAHEPRQIAPAVTGDEDLGPFKLLPGTWANLPGLPGRGWNMIALPFAVRGGRPGSPSGSRPGFRLLVNQYNEQLKFNLVDKAVPNRGIALAPPRTKNRDQKVVTIDYEQSIAQIAADDFPASGLPARPARRSTTSRGCSSACPTRTGSAAPTSPAWPPSRTATSRSASATPAPIDGAPTIPKINALPLGVDQSLDNPYLAPYRHYHDNPFEGLFDPTDPTALLDVANADVTIVRTTILEFDTTVATGGISNIPFIVEQANASEMKATFFLQELAETDRARQPEAAPAVRPGRPARLLPPLRRRPGPDQVAARQHQHAGEGRAGTRHALRPAPAGAEPTPHVVCPTGLAAASTVASRTSRRGARARGDRGNLTPSDRWSVRCSGPW